MNQSDQTCSLCSQQFTQTNLAWIISLCGHNICNQCLKHCLTLKVKSITCKQCKCKYNVDQEILEEFPKNITILKNLRDLKNGEGKDGKQGKEGKKEKDGKSGKKGKEGKQGGSVEGSMLLSSASVKLDVNDCQKHGKPLQIICTVDRCLLCAHCALFGQHQNHTFKTLQQFLTEYQTYKSTYSSLQHQKQTIQQTIRSKRYKTALITKISEIKDKLVIQIRDRFAKLAGLVKDAENRVFQELVRCFRGVDSQVSRVTKEEMECQRVYARWRNQVYQYIKSIDQMTQIKNKIQIFYRPNRPTLTQGHQHFKQLERTFTSLKEAVTQKIQSIQVEYNAGIQGHIYNYANILVNPNQIKSRVRNDVEEMDRKERERERDRDRDREDGGFGTGSYGHGFGRKEMKIQFVRNGELESLKDVRSVEKEKEAIGKKDQLIKTSRGNQLHKVKSNPKLPKTLTQTPKRLTTPPKTHHHKPTQHPKHEQNLQHAQRMLHEFLTSSDTLDLTSCELTDEQLHHIISQASRQKPIKCLKLAKNKLSNSGLAHLVEFLSSVTNVNLAYNGLGDQAVDVFVEKRQYMPCLRIINLSHNKVNQRKVKAKLEELRKIGVITTL